MKIFIATPEAKRLTVNNIYINYEFTNVLESFFYVKKNIEKKYTEVVEYNTRSRRND